MESWPVLLAPVSSIPAFEAGRHEFVVAGTAVPPMGLVASCRAIGLLGLPAASVPCARASDGAVISVQVVGRPLAEHEVLAVAAALERALAE
jgi:amidase